MHSRQSPNSRQWLIMALAAVTAVVHVVLAFQFVPGPDPTFILNGIGYLGLAGLLYLPLSFLAPADRYRGLLRWVLIAYTAVTIVAWLLIGVGSPFSGMPMDPLGVKSIIAYVTKLVEIAIIVLVWQDSRGQ